MQQRLNMLQRLGRRLLMLLALMLPLSGMAADSMQLWVTVDWEGLTLEEDNLQSMRAFREKFPYIPLLHLINPTYFIQPDVNRAQIGSHIRSTFLAHDTVGLHVHAMRSLVEYCGVTFQATPSIADAQEDCAHTSCGYSVSLEYAYTQQELTRLVACSSDLLTANGFQRPRHFRAGAWQFGPKLQAALEANRFVWDSSNIPASLLSGRWHQDSSMIRLLKKLHPHSTPLQQPFALSMNLIEYPDNAALADYTNTKELLQLFEQLANAHHPVMVLGFHQETAADYLIRLERAIPRMEKLAREKNLRIEWMH
jgi:hypothetical protein